MDDKNPMNLKIKVYIAGSSLHEMDRARGMMDAVNDHPYLQITHDWIKVIERVRKTLPDHKLTDEHRVMYAMQDMDGIQDADVFWLLYPEQPSAGAMFEYGVAWGLAAQWSMQGMYTGHTGLLIISGKNDHLFCSLADKRFPSDAAALRWLANHAKELIEP